MEKLLTNNKDSSLQLTKLMGGLMATRGYGVALETLSSKVQFNLQQTM